MTSFAINVWKTRHIDLLLKCIFPLWDGRFTRKWSGLSYQEKNLFYHLQVSVTVGPKISVTLECCQCYR